MNKLWPVLLIVALLWGGSWVANSPDKVGDWTRKFREASQSNQTEPGAFQPVAPAEQPTIAPLPTIPPPSFPEGAMTEAGWNEIPRGNVSLTLYSLTGGTLDYYLMQIEEVSGAGGYLKSSDQRCTVASENYYDAVTCNGTLVLEATREADGSMDSIRAQNGFRFTLK